MKIIDKTFIAVFFGLMVITGAAVLMGHTHQLVMFGLCLFVYLGLKWDLKRAEKLLKRKK